MSKRSTEHPEEGTLLLIDQQDFTRECIADLLRRSARDIAVTAVAELALAENLGPWSTILINADCAALDDAAVAAEIGNCRRAFPEAPIAVLSSLRIDVPKALEAVRGGVRGVLSTSQSRDQIVSALRLMISGGIYIAGIGEPRDDGDDGALPEPEPAAPPAPEGDRAAALTSREIEVLAQLKHGRPNKIIAFELGISENTVKVHVARILKKLDADNRTQVAFFDARGDVYNSAP